MIAVDKALQTREAIALDFARIRELGGMIDSMGTRFWVAEAGGHVIACLGESDGHPGVRWLTDWFCDGSRLGKVALLRLVEDFEQRAKADGTVQMLVGISEPSEAPNLEAAVNKGWSVLGVFVGKAI